MHVFDADLAAIGPPQDRDDLAQARALASENVVEENLAVEIGLAEAVAAVIELGIGPALLEPERVEIGFEMAPHAIGADQLQGADRVRCRPPQRRCIGDRRRYSPAVAGRPFRRLYPNGGAQFGERRRSVLADLAEKSPPTLIDRCGIVEKAGIETGNKPGIGAGQKARAIDISHQRL